MAEEPRPGTSVVSKKEEERPILKASPSQDKAPTNSPDDTCSNFFVHGKVVRFAPRSLFVFDEASAFRQAVVWLIQWKWFDRFIMFLIMTNSIILALVNYDLHAIDPETMEPDPSKDWRNRVVEETEPIFLGLFVFELVLKVIGMGFFLDKGSYLRDGWNWLDFIVVASGLLSIVPGMPKLSVLRTFRVLRPLRSLTVLPGLRLLVGSLLSSIPQLLSVMALLGFVFLVFGILGLQLWGGLLHFRCRVTPRPVFIDPVDVTPAFPGDNPKYFLLTSAYFAGADATDPALFAEAETYVTQLVSDRVKHPFCGAGQLVDPSSGSTETFPATGIPLSDSGWSQSSSPWRTERSCVWPIDETDTFVCGSGSHACPASQACGSNFDDFGNPRFVSHRFQKSGTFIGELNYGITNFDNVGTAFLSIFQCITLEGWVDIMYQLQDAYFPQAVVSVYFVLLVVFGSFFLINLTLAVIWENFSLGQKEEEDMAEQAREQEAMNVARRRASTTSLATDGGGAGVGGSGTANSSVNGGGDNTAVAPGIDDTKEEKGARDEILREFRGESIAGLLSNSFFLGTSSKPLHIHAQPKRPENVSRLRLWCAKLVSSGRFGFFIISLIIINTVVLSMDHHPMDKQFRNTLEAVNFALSAMFTLEMGIKLYALGFRAYIKDPFNVFDAFIVIVSLVELVLTPPTFFVGGDDTAGGGAVSALRTFRLFRVFKLARNWVSLRVLLQTIAKTLRDVANFSILLLLFIFIFALIGMQQFANRFRFDPESGEALTLTDPGYGDAEMPRSNFDDLLHSTVTIFQILTVENWNAVMYDGFRARGPMAVIYFVLLVVLGNFIVLNLFLAILLGNFEGLEALSSEEQTKQNTHNKLRAAQRGGAGSGNDSSGGGGGGGGRSRRGSQSSRRRGRRRRWQHVCARLFAPVLTCVTCGCSFLHSLSDENAENKYQELKVAFDKQELAKKVVPSPVAPVVQRRRRVGEMFPQHRPLRIGDAGATAGVISSPEGPPPFMVEAAFHMPSVASLTTAGSAHNINPTNHSNASTPSNPQLRRTSQSSLRSIASRRSLQPPSLAFPTRRSQHRSSVAGQSHATASDVPPSPSVAPPTVFADGSSGYSLCVFGTAGWIRRTCQTVIHHRLFEGGVLLLILVSSIALAIDSPLRDPSSDTAIALAIIDLILAVLFTLEMAFKVVAKGFLFGNGAYLRSSWNVLDCLIVIVSWIDIASSSSSIKSLRSLRALRALRPLRVVSRNPGLKLVVNALFRAIPQILNVIFVCALFFLIFGIIGVNYFKGAFHHCTGPVYDSLTPAQQDLITHPVPFSAEVASAAGVAAGDEGYADTTSKAVCQWFGASWELTRDQNFDHIIFAMAALFEMSTTEQWVDIMYQGVDSRGADMQPVEGNNRAWVVFFIAFMIVGSFFVMNLFVGVVIDNFNRMKDEMGENVLLTDAQREWARTQEQMMHMRLTAKAHPPVAWWRAVVFHIVQHESFEGFIMFCIMVNTGVLAAQYFGISEGFENGLEVANYCFAGIFTLEAVLKLVGLGWAQYFKDSWNRFDFAIVLGTDVGLVVSWVFGTDFGALATLVRAFRVGRIVRLVHSAKSLRILFTTLLVTLPSLVNVGSLLFLLLFVYAVMGIQLFAFVAFEDGGTDEHANFRSFWSALLLLIRASTGENWNGIMYNLARSPPGCNADSQWDDEELNGCGTSVAAYLYFITFTLVVSFVMLNVFIAVILEGFADIAMQEDAKLSTVQLEKFAAAWVELDPDATMYMSTTDLRDFFRLLPAPMGLFSPSAPPPTADEIMQMIDELKLPTYRGNTVHFTDVSVACARRVIAMSLAQGETLDELPPEHKISRKWQKLKGATDKMEYDVRQFYAITRIAETFRTFRFRRRLADLVGDEDGDSGDGGLGGDRLSGVGEEGEDDLWDEPDWVHQDSLGAGGGGAVEMKEFPAGFRDGKED